MAHLLRPRRAHASPGRKVGSRARQQRKTGAFDPVSSAVTPSEGATTHGWLQPLTRSVAVVRMPLSGRAGRLRTRAGHTGGGPLRFADGRTASTGRSPPQRPSGRPHEAGTPPRLAGEL